MDFNDYVDLVKGNVIKLDVEGEKNHYITVPSGLDSTFMKLMKNRELDEPSRILKVMAHALCDENGKRIFDPENSAHLEIITKISPAIQMSLINKMAEILFPKKKVLKAQK